MAMNSSISKTHMRKSRPKLKLSCQSTLDLKLQSTASQFFFRIAYLGVQQELLRNQKLCRDNRCFILNDIMQQIVKPRHEMTTEDETMSQILSCLQEYAKHFETQFRHRPPLFIALLLKQNDSTTTSSYINQLIEDLIKIKTRADMMSNQQNPTCPPQHHPKRSLFCCTSIEPCQ